MALPTKTTKWGDREARRRDILDAGRALLEREGLQRLNIRDVAQGAGVSPGTVYTYFGSREGLFAALYAERLDRFHAEITPVCAQADSPEALLAQIADRYLDVYRVFGREVNLWSVLALDPDADAVPAELVGSLLEAAAQVMATVQGALDRFADDLDAGDAKLRLPFLWATLTGLADHFTGERHHLHPYSWEEMAEFAARMLVRALRLRKDTDNAST